MIAVDCIMSAWTQWSRCSVTCGLGSLFRQRDVLRDARTGGACGGAQFDSRACFLQACPGQEYCKHTHTLSPSLSFSLSLSCTALLYIHSFFLYLSHYLIHVHLYFSLLSLSVFSFSPFPYLSISQWMGRGLIGPPGPRVMCPVVGV